MGLSDSVVIIISILIAGFVVITGAVITKFLWSSRGDSGDSDFAQRSNEQEVYMREVRSRNRAWNHFESRFGDRGQHSYGPKTAGASTVSASNVYSAA